MGSNSTKEEYGLCFSGGGVLCICHAGVISALEELNHLSKFTHFTGASGGSIAAALCALRTPSKRVRDYLSVNFNDFLDDDYGVVRDSIRLWKEMGYYKGDALHIFLSKLFTLVSGVTNITFAQAYIKYNTTLTIPATKVYKDYCLTEYLSHTTTPDMSIATACRLSCTYPLLFCSLDNFSDGGILDNYPIDSLKCINKYGVAFTSTYSSEEYPSNAYEYVSSIISTLHTKVNEAKYNANTLLIPVSISSTKFSLTDDEKEKLFSTSKDLALDRFRYFSSK